MSGGAGKRDKVVAHHRDRRGSYEKRGDQVTILHQRDPRHTARLVLQHRCIGVWQVE